MQMTYRCRGGHNGIGGIIRGPPRKPLFQPEENETANTENHHDPSDPSVTDSCERQPQTNISPMPSPLLGGTPVNTTMEEVSLITPSPSGNDNTNNQVVNGITTNHASNGNLDGPLVISDECGNPAKVNSSLHPEGGLW